MEAVLAKPGFPLAGRSAQKRGDASAAIGPACSSLANAYQLRLALGSSSFWNSSALKQFAPARSSARLRPASPRLFVVRSASVWKQREVPRRWVADTPSIDVALLPNQGSFTGVVCFLHGFEQMPQDYDNCLQGLAQQGLFMVAPIQPRLFDGIVKDQGGGALALQAIVRKDAIQIAQLLLSVDEHGVPELNQYNAEVPPIKEGSVVAMAGHSLGGGTTFSVLDSMSGNAKLLPVTHLALMSPFPQLADNKYTPKTVISEKTFTPPPNILILEANLDFLAWAPTINTDIVKPLQAKPKATSKVDVYSFPFGNHTGYSKQATFFGGAQFPGGVLLRLPEEVSGPVTGFAASLPLKEDKDSESSWWLKLGILAAVALASFGAASSADSWQWQWLLNAVGAVATGLGVARVPWFKDKNLTFVAIVSALVAVAAVSFYKAGSAEGLASELLRAVGLLASGLALLEFFWVGYYGPKVQMPETTKKFKKFLYVVKESGAS